MIQLFYLWLVSKTLLCGCSPEQKKYDFDKVRSKYRIRKVGNLPAQVKESSGLARGSLEGTFWTHSDGGNAPELFQADTAGRLVKVLKLNGLRNVDWEDLAEDGDGRLYIGDFGNNSGLRKDLSVKILPEGWEHRSEPAEPESITLRYSGQPAAVSAGRREGADCEAFFFHRDSLYFFSKSTGKAPRYTRLYSTPALPGEYVLNPVDSIRIGETVTGADVSPDGKRFALISYGKLLVFGIREGKVDFSMPLWCMRAFRGQTEAILFLGEEEWLVTNEKGKLYRISLR